MKFERAALVDAWLIRPEPAADARGCFVRTFCEREFAAHGLETRYVQHSVSCSIRAGTLRGMHFQTEPHGETKLVRCSKGAIFDVIVDLRPGSPSHACWQGFELSAATGDQLYVPEGFAHGFVTLTDDAEVTYLISRFYAPEAASGVRHDDPRFAIAWPRSVTTISERDASWPDYCG